MTDLFEAATPTTRRPGKPIPSWKPPELPPRRSRRRPLVALAIAVVLLGGLGIGLWLQVGSTPATTTAQTQSRPQQQPQQPPPPGSAVVAPPLEPPAGVEGVTPPANPAPPDRRAPAAAPAPPAQSPAAVPAPIPPSVDGQLVSPNPIRRAGCDGDRASVIAKISSDGEPRAVTLLSRGPDGIEKAAPMVKIGSAWIAALGPYGVVGKITWMVRVTDAHGVTVTGPTSTLPVVSC